MTAQTLRREPGLGRARARRCLTLGATLVGIAASPQVALAAAPEASPLHYQSYFADGNNAGQITEATDTGDGTGSWGSFQFPYQSASPGTRPALISVSGQPQVFFATGTTTKKIFEWAFDPAQGWKPDLPGGGALVADSSSPAAITYHNDARVFWVDAGNGNRISQLAWNYSSGWTIDHLQTGAVAPNTSPTVTMLASGVPRVFYVDAATRRVAQIGWNTDTGWGAGSLISSHHVAAGTSPAATNVANGDPRVYYVDADAGNTVTQVAWGSSSGWNEGPLGGHRVAAGTSPTAMHIANGDPRVYFVDADASNHVSELGWGANGWGTFTVPGPAVLPNTSPSVTTVAGIPHVFYADATTSRLWQSTWNPASSWTAAVVSATGVTGAGPATSSMPVSIDSPARADQYIAFLRATSDAVAQAYLSALPPSERTYVVQAQRNAFVDGRLYRNRGDGWTYYYGGGTVNRITTQAAAAANGFDLNAAPSVPQAAIDLATSGEDINDSNARSWQYGGADHSVDSTPEIDSLAGTRAASDTFGWGEIWSGLRASDRSALGYLAPSGPQLSFGGDSASDIQVQDLPDVDEWDPGTATRAGRSVKYHQKSVQVTFQPRCKPFFSPNTWRACGGSYTQAAVYRFNIANNVVHVASSPKITFRDDGEGRTKTTLANDPIIDNGDNHASSASADDTVQMEWAAVATPSASVTITGAAAFLGVGPSMSGGTTLTQNTTRTFFVQMRIRAYSDGGSTVKFVYWKTKAICVRQIVSSPMSTGTLGPPAPPSSSPGSVNHSEACNGA